MQALACYAASDESSLGRQYQDSPSPYRSLFQRDRDRIVHCSAFRRLEYKTQVFLSHEGDMFRTRLTHSLEVSQIGRTVARALEVNEDLVEAICLAHDLGHTPFGHAGQSALNDCLRDHGGFEHNMQSLRVVDVLEEKYAEHDGLNLGYETREGILKHCSLKNARKLGSLGERFLQKKQPSLEAQIANIADEIAYNNHDVDDGLRAGLISIDGLRECEIIDSHYRDIRGKWPGLEGKKLTHELVRLMINSLVTDLVENSLENIRQAQFKSVHEVRESSKVTVCLGPKMQEMHAQLKQYLRKNLYNHQNVREMADRSKRIVTELYQHYLDGGDAQQDFSKPREDILCDEPRISSIKDYIAGMTDRFALMEHERIFGNVTA